MYRWLLLHYIMSSRITQVRVMSCSCMLLSYQYMFYVFQCMSSSCLSCPVIHVLIFITLVHCFVLLYGLWTSFDVWDFRVGLQPVNFTVHCVDRYSTGIYFGCSGMWCSPVQIHLLVALHKHLLAARYSVDLYMFNIYLKALLLVHLVSKCVHSLCSHALILVVAY